MDPRLVLYDYAKSFLGLPYIWGGDEPLTGFDCSGLCVELLKSVGVLERNADLTASGLQSLCKAHPLEEAELGALAFFGSSSITHVGFCLNSQLMIEAGSGTSATKTLGDAIKQHAYIRVRPIHSRKDFIGVFRPDYPWSN